MTLGLQCGAVWCGAVRCGAVRGGGFVEMFPPQTCKHGRPEHALGGGHGTILLYFAFCFFRRWATGSRPVWKEKKLYHIYRQTTGTGPGTIPSSLSCVSYHTWWAAAVRRRALPPWSRGPHAALLNIQICRAGRTMS